MSGLTQWPVIQARQLVSRMLVALLAAAFVDPADETAQTRAFSPHQMQEFARRKIGSGRPKECFHAPAQVRAFPGTKTVALGDEPIVAKGAQHVLEAGNWKLEAARENEARRDGRGSDVCTKEILTEKKAGR